MAEFAQVNLVARNIAASIDFYRLLGVDIPEPREYPEGSGALHIGVQMGAGAYLQFDNDALARMYNASWQSGEGSRIMLGFTLPSSEAVDVAYHHVVAAGHEVRQPPYDAYWGVRYAIVVDPDGNDVSLSGPADPAKEYTPPR